MKFLSFHFTLLNYVLLMLSDFYFLFLQFLDLNFYFRFIHCYFLSNFLPEVFFCNYCDCCF